MQHVAVDIVRLEMFEGTRHRLRDLNGKPGCRIIGQPVILPALIGKFGLKKKICARDDSGAIGGGHPSPDTLFEVVPALVGRVYPSESRAESKFGQGRSAIFLPRGAVEKMGYEGRLVDWH